MDNIKKQIAADWINAFPQLTLYTSTKLYKVIGPIVVGLELIKLRDNERYRPHFVIFPLLRKAPKSDFGFAIIFKEFYDEKGFQYNITYTNQHIVFDQLVENIKKQINISLDRDVRFDEIVELFDFYSHQPPLSAAPSSFKQAALQEVKLKIAIIIGHPESEKILRQIESREWDIKHFEASGINISEWLQNLRNDFNNPQALLQEYQTNRAKVSHLQSSEIITSEATKKSNMLTLFGWLSKKAVRD